MKSYLIEIFFLAGIFISADIVNAANWNPMVKIPGIPSTGIDLSTYLVGLYQFMLSVVGIVAVMMLIVAGMRYITAAGNAASVTDAKSIAGSAITGLLLALLSFVILKTINPDVLYLKKPGSNFAASVTTVDFNACGSFSHAGNCVCRNSEIMSAPVPADSVACASACNTTARCDGSLKTSCLDSNFKQSFADNDCHCLNGYVYNKGTFASCQALCSDLTYNNGTDNGTNSNNHAACVRLDLAGTINSLLAVQFVDTKSDSSFDVIESFNMNVMDTLHIKSSVKDPMNYFPVPYSYSFYFRGCVDNGGPDDAGVFIDVPVMSNKSEVFQTVKVDHVNQSTDENLDCLPYIVLYDSAGHNTTTGLVRIKIAPHGWLESCQAHSDCKSGTCTPSENCTAF